MDELEQMRLVAAAWRNRAHVLLDQIVAMDIAAGVVGGDDPGDDGTEEVADG